MRRFLDLMEPELLLLVIQQREKTLKV